MDVVQEGGLRSFMEVQAMRQCSDDVVVWRAMRAHDGQCNGGRAYAQDHC